jgi:hypothetical protein
MNADTGGVFAWGLYDWDMNQGGQNGNTFGWAGLDGFSNGDVLVAAGGIGGIAVGGNFLDLVLNFLWQTTVAGVAFT